MKIGGWRKDKSPSTVHAHCSIFEKCVEYRGRAVDAKVAVHGREGTVRQRGPAPEAVDAAQLARPLQFVLTGRGAPDANDAPVR